MADYAERRAELLAASAPPGPERRRALSDLTDAWLAGLFVDGGGTASGCALVALGSLGRRELSPGSDLDLMLLRPQGLSDARAAEVADRVWYPVWDGGVRLDHSVRTPGEARRVAADDVRALLGMLDVRHVAGDVALTEAVRASMLSDWRALAARRLPELMAATAERADRAGDVAFALEPDLKEARGGLRDVTVLRAVAASWVADPPHRGLVEATSTLLDVRDALHLVTGRRSDRLVLQEQDEVARRLGLLDGDQLLRTVGRAGRTVAYAAQVTWHRVERAQAATGRRARFLVGPRRLASTRERAPLADGVVEQDGEAVLARDARPDLDGALVLRAAAAAAQHGLPLATHTVDRLAAECPPIQEPWPAPARDALVSLLGAGPATVSVWEAMDQAGLVVHLLPDWERVRSRPQRNPVHRFTVDRHLVETTVQASALTRRVGRPDLLLVSALLHDVGKGWPGDHTDAGVVVVADVAPRLGFDAPDTEVLVTLVRHHLLLPNTATRRDLEDPATAASVAAAVGTPELLDLLHALTEADALATGPAAWSDWKAALVADLVARTHRVLRASPGAGPVEPVEPPEPTGEQRSLLASDGVAVVVAPAAYGFEVTVAADDRTGLLATVAGVLSLHRLVVRAAQVKTVGRRALQVWTVHPEFGRPPDAGALRADLRRAVTGSLDVGDRLDRRAAESPDRTGRAAPPPLVEVVNGASSVATVLEVRAHDRPGLLHRVAGAVAASGADVRSALVSTLGSEVVDVFYVVDRVGRPLAPAPASALAQAVRAALR